jgi:LysR family glycine cleavage system transcriptional activator
VSKQIRLLEEHYATKLLVRSHRQLSVTETGMAMLPHAHEIFEQLLIVDRLVKNQSAILALQVYVSFAVRWLMPRLGKFYQVHSQSQLRIETMVREVTDLDESNQVRILHGTGNWAGMKADLLLAEQLTPVCAPSLMSGNRPLRTIDDLVGYTLLHTASDRQEWLAWLAANGIDSLDPYKHQFFDLHHLAWTAAANNLGIAMGDLTLIQDDLKSGALICPFDKVLRTHSGYYLVYPEFCMQNNLFAAFRNWLLEEIRRSGAA